jgi:xanthine/CO dehydrogenase XdhC/CoxF family maturation factor
VKHWQELGQVLRRVAHLEQDRCRAALAVVVRIQGSAYRRPGARLLVLEGDEVIGGVSGGCLEEDVRQVGLAVIRSGRSRLLSYETGDDDSKVWGLGLGCDGRVEILVQPLTVEDLRGPWARVLDLLEGDLPFVVSTLAGDGAPPGAVVFSEGRRLAGHLGGGLDGVIDASALAALRARQTDTQMVDGAAVFHDVLVPPPKLLVVGGGADAEPLVEVASRVGFRVYLADHRPALLDERRHPSARRRLLRDPDDDLGELPLDAETYAVVKTHSLKRDTAWVARLLQTEIPYVGILGPRARTGKILAEVGSSARERVYGPVGLDLGAEGPEQVALSVVAEILSVHSGRKPHSLRERALAVHAE